MHYGSPRLRRDAKQELGEITNHFSILIANLIKSRYQDAKELQKKLSQAEERAAATQIKYEMLLEQNRNAESSRQALEAKQQELDGILAALQRTLA